MHRLVKNIAIVALVTTSFNCESSAADLFSDPHPLDSPEWRDLGKNGFLGPNSIYLDDERVGAYAIFTKREGGTDYKPTIWVLKSVLNEAKQKFNIPLVRTNNGRSYFSTMTLFEVDCLNYRLKEKASYSYTGTYATGDSHYGLYSNGEYIHIPPTSFQYGFFKATPEGFCKKQ